MFCSHNIYSEKRIFSKIIKIICYLWTKDKISIHSIQAPRFPMATMIIMNTIVIWNNEKINLTFSDWRSNCYVSRYPDTISKVRQWKYYIANQSFYLSSRTLHFVITKKTENGKLFIREYSFQSINKKCSGPKITRNKTLAAGTLAMLTINIYFV